MTISESAIYYVDNGSLFCGVQPIAVVAPVPSPLHPTFATLLDEWTQRGGVRPGLMNPTDVTFARPTDAA